MSDVAAKDAAERTPRRFDLLDFLSVVELGEDRNGLVPTAPGDLVDRPLS